MKRAIGIFGGSFNPIHNGHLRCAWETLHHLNLKKIYFVPNYKANYKETISIDVKHRVNMLQLALQDIDEFEISLYEVEQQDYTYTLQTIRYFKEKYPEYQLYFLMGLDSLVNFHLWHDCRAIFDYAHVVVFSRPKISFSFELAHNQWLLSHYCLEKETLQKILHGKLFFCDTSLIDIESSQILYNLQLGIDARFLIPDIVKEYIEKEKPYLL